jgi:transketolase
LLPGVLKVAIEAGSPMGWHRYVGEKGGFVTIDCFGRSGPCKEVMEKFGFNVDNVVSTVKRTIA